MPPEAVDRAATVEAADDIAATVRDCDFIFEAAPEEPALKYDVLRALAAAARPDAMIASNTSSFPIDDLAEHVVNGPNASSACTGSTRPNGRPASRSSRTTRPTPPEDVARGSFLRAIGKRPAIVRSAPGFVANRIQNALFREALACVEEGLASPREVDEVCRSTFGFRMPFFGPFQIADMAGLDVWESVAGTMERAYGERFAMPPILHELVAQGRSARRAARASSPTRRQERDQMLLERDRRYAALNRLLADFPPLMLPD